MDDQSMRFSMPLLAAGQAQKEVLHNEALTSIDLLMHAIAETIGDNSPPAAPNAGQSWIVGPSPTGAWSARADMLASWTTGGWRFTAPVEGMRVWIRASGTEARRGPSAWVNGTVQGTKLVVGGVQVVGARGPAIAAPTGGSVVDAQARSTLASVLSALQSHGLISS